MSLVGGHVCKYNPGISSPPAANIFNQTNPTGPAKKHTKHTKTKSHQNQKQIGLNIISMNPNKPKHGSNHQPHQHATKCKDESQTLED